ncbi:hypothetical protein Hanom_Chr16g01456391 [Helianthus anomalus]
MPNELTDRQLSNEMEAIALIIFLEMLVSLVSRKNVYIGKFLKYIEDMDLRRFMKIRQADTIG